MKIIVQYTTCTQWTYPLWQAILDTLGPLPEALTPGILSTCIAAVLWASLHLPWVVAGSTQGHMTRSSAPWCSGSRPAYRSEVTMCQCELIHSQLLLLVTPCMWTASHSKETHTQSWWRLVWVADLLSPISSAAAAGAQTSQPHVFLTLKRLTVALIDALIVKCHLTSNTHLIIFKGRLFWPKGICRLLTRSCKQLIETFGWKHPTIEYYQLCIAPQVTFHHTFLLHTPHILAHTMHAVLCGGDRKLDKWNMCLCIAWLQCRETHSHSHRHLQWANSIGAIFPTETAWAFLWTGFCSCNHGSYLTFMLQSCKHNPVTALWHSYDNHMTIIWQSYDSHVTVMWQLCDSHVTEVMYQSDLCCICLFCLAVIVSPFLGHSSVGVHSPSCSTVPGGQPQPERHTSGQGTFGSSQVPVQGAHWFLLAS